MRRILVAMLLILTLVLAACGGGTPPAEEEGPQAEEPTAEVVEEPTEEMVEEEPTEEMVEEEPTEEVAEEEPTEEAEEEPTEEAEEEPAGGDDISAMLPEELGSLSVENNLLTLDAGGCDYGGKFAAITATGPYEVVFDLCSPDPAFEAKIAFEGFGIHPMEHLIATGGTGALLEQPIGTGPYKLDTWSRGDSIVLTANEDWWGDAPLDPTVVIRWNSEGAQRLVELQSGQVDQISFVGPEDIATVEGDPNLQLIPYSNPNIMYLAFTNTFEPFTDQRVRQAIAMGIDRQRIVDNFYPEGSEVASHFTPCSIPNGCEGEDWYEFDLEAARELLAEAGYPDGFDTSLYYRDVFRVYLPEPGLVAQEIQAQLAENLNINVEIVVMESGEFLAESSAGNLDGMYMLGWGADYPHVTNFLDYHFSSENPQFGDPFADIYEPLREASSIADIEEAAALYVDANNAIKANVPMVPIAHGAAADAALADVTNAHVPPFGAPNFELVDSADDTFVYMQAAEPISLYCNDETDGETFRVCKQINESLLGYAIDSGETVPALATECVANEDATQYTCTLREGVVFHDGTTFDANDVVMTFAVGLDASNPLHVGNTGAWEYWSYLWGIMNAPEE